MTNNFLAYLKLTKGPSEENYLELDSNFDSNPVSSSNSDSDSDCNSVFMNLDFLFSLFCVCILLNKLVDNYFFHFHNRIDSYTKFVLITLLNSLTLAFMYFSS